MNSIQKLLLKNYHLLRPVLFPVQCSFCKRMVSETPAQVCRVCLPRLVHTLDHVLYFQKYCSCCYEPMSVENTESLCTACSLFPEKIKSIRFLYHYADEAREFIHLLKYSPTKLLYRQLAMLVPPLIEPLFDFDASWEMILPIPSSRTRHKDFQPLPLFIAQKISKHLSIPLNNSLNFLTANGIDPTTYGSKKLDQRFTHSRHRKMTLENTFLKSCSSILIIDDVLSSGATLLNAVQALRSYTEAQIYFFALARSPNWIKFRRERNQYL